MKTLAPLKTSGPSLTLLAAAALLNAGSTFAAGFADDAQAQARALLSGSSGTRAATAYSLLPLAGTPEPTPEAQEQARGLLTGKLIFRSGSRESASDATSPASPQDAGHAYIGAQETARKMILGKSA